MYLRLLTILSALVLSEATFFGLAKLIGKLFEVEKCPKVPEPITTDETYCGERPRSCDPSYKYRSYDGSCNNLKHPWWGTPYTPYKRLVPNTYSDGVHKFPRSINNEPLPNPRELSLRLFQNYNKDDVLWTLGFMQYGQVIAHDLSLTADIGQTVTFVACCKNGRFTEAAETKPRCAPILIPESDTFNKRLGKKCLNFYRTQSTHDREDCKYVTRVAEPMTAVTGSMDASYLYGSSKAENKRVREFEGGRLKSVIKNKTEYLPQVAHPFQVCAVKKATDACYQAGDVRVNQNPQLALLHNIYMIHHNFVADALYYLNPHWNDEKTFQETRKIVIAVHQHIFYNEMLVFMIGASVLANHKVVYPGVMDYVEDYDPNVNLSPSVEFSTAAFRFFHTEIKGHLKSFTESRFVNGSIELSKWFDKPFILEEEDYYAGLTRGLATQPQGAVDGEIDIQIQNYLFRGEKGGTDLKAVDILRGRDHGLATYAQFVEKCCLGKLETWIDAEKFFKIKDVEIMKTLYSSPQDIDLVVGIGLENLVPVSLTGPVAACIIADQFRRTRQGDRFFYQRKDYFTKEQLNEILHTNFGDLLCLAKGVKEMQPKAMEQVSFVNPLIPCRSRTRFDFSHWIEDPK